MPPIKSSAFKHHTYITLTIFSFSKVMPSYSRCLRARLVYITIATPFVYQPASYTECIKANIYSLCDVHSISNSKYTHPIYL